MTNALASTFTLGIVIFYILMPHLLCEIIPVFFFTLPSTLSLILTLKPKNFDEVKPGQL